MNLAQILLTFAATSLLAMTACEKRTVVVVEKPPGEPIAQTKTLETSGLKASIDAYEQAPTAERAADVRKAFAELDGEIAELQGHVAKETGSEQAEAAQKLANLSAYRAAEAKRFEQAGGSRPTGIVVDPRPGVEKVEVAARKTGEALKDAAKETRDAIKDAVR
jgi:hypothetical protein